MSTKAEAQRQRRAFDRLVGACIESGCRERTALHSRVRCEYHLSLNLQGSARYRERLATKRGWRLVRVPVEAS